MNVKSLHLVTILILLIRFSVCAQPEKEYVNFPTPNAAGLGLYGSVPVNHFTGIPNINIPIYTLDNGGVKVPISLSYHVGSIKPHNHPGWVGFGWSLFAGGAITRTVKGLPDEMKTNIRSGGNPYYTGYYFNYNKLNNSNWYSISGLNTLAYDAVWGVPYYYETMPDEFHFNFLGYSGSFYLDHNGEWIVKSDQNVRVEFDETTGFAEKSDLRQPFNAVHNYSEQTLFFNEFTIITEDGTRYKFGGKYANEYSFPFRKQHGLWVLSPTTWSLIKITTVTGEVVDFEYNSGRKHGDNDNQVRPICSVAPQSGWSSFYGEEADFLSPECNSQNIPIDSNKLYGYLLFPSYLEKITSGDISIDFNTSESTELRYDEDALKLTEAPLNSTEYKNRYVFYSFESLLKWLKLDEINVRYKDQLINRFQFDYTNSTDTRLKLLALKETSNNTSLDETKFKTHKFDYHFDSSYAMPGYSTKQIDYWGFYNKGGKQGPKDYYYEYREPYIYVEPYKAEVLEKITYPTGGYTEFEFERHWYRESVNKDRALLPLDTYTTNQMAGGLRIYRTKDYSSPSATPITKTYYYVKGYTGGGNISGLPSSGVLNGKWQYVWDSLNGVDVAGIPYNYVAFSSNSFLSDPFNSFGSHVGYSEVVESTDGVGYTIYKYTNYDEDENDPNNTHMDLEAITNTNPETSLYSPFSSRSLERGKMTSIRSFNENGIKVSEKTFEYEKSSDDFIRAVQTEYQNICSGQQASRQAVYGTAYRIYTYDYNLVRTTDVTYDVNGNNPIATTTEYDYVDSSIATQNGINILRQEIAHTSKNEDLTVNYKYPFDYVSDINDPSVLSQLDALSMFDDFVVGPVVRKDLELNGTPLSSQATKYKNWGLTVDLDGDGTAEVFTAYLPELIKSSKGINTLEEEVVYHDYDDNGNLIEASKKDGTHILFVWGYGGEYPIAKIENATYELGKSNTVTNSQLNLIATAISSSGNDTDDGTENALHSSLQLLRDGFPDAMVTSYTYNPLIGITSVTDSKGYTTYYSFDDFNRLEFVKDSDGKVLSKTEYNYKSQP